jgi:pimeloyl-ACP methyl ester carboxylesterase
MTNRGIPIYAISGLGADGSAFRNLRIQGHYIVHLPWIEPLKKESLKDYTKRLTTEIRDSQPIFLGLSFGGLVACEAAGIFNSQKLLLISVPLSKNERAWFFKMLSKWSFHKLLPPALIKSVFLLSLQFLAPMKYRHLDILKQMLNKMSGTYYSWALNMLSSQRVKIPKISVKRWHGERDLFIPKPGKETIVIPNAGHLMILTHGRVLSRQISQFLNH